LITNDNKTPEQLARDRIDARLLVTGWDVQSKAALDFSAALGVAVREYQTDIGPADYALFIDGRPVGIIEAKPESWGQKITTVEEQSAGYAAATLKWVDNDAGVECGRVKNRALRIFPPNSALESVSKALKSSAN